LQTRKNLLVAGALWKLRPGRNGKMKKLLQKLLKYNGSATIAASTPTVTLAGVPVSGKGGERGRWTLRLVRPDGVSCVVDSGRGTTPILGEGKTRWLYPDKKTGKRPAMVEYADFLAEKAELEEIGRRLIAAAGEEAKMPCLYRKSCASLVIFGVCYGGECPVKKCPGN
jgi:hypothetical protein